MGDIETNGLCEAETAANRETVGVSQGSYTRVKPLLGAGNVNYYVELKEYSLSSSTRVKITGRHVPPRYGSYVKFWRTSSGQPSTCNLYCGQPLFTRAYSGNGTRSEPLYKTKTGYYEILEVSPTATHAQIKTAYYKQSFIYHPDRNANSDEATVRFSEISEAYTVLGNKGLRKKYDRGLLSASDLTGTARPSAKDATGGSGKQRAESRRSAVGTESQGGMFDFDKFYRSHYSEQLQRERDLRARREEMLRKQSEPAGNKQLGIEEIGIVLLLLATVGIMLSLGQ